MRSTGFTSGLTDLDRILEGIWPGDNVVFQVDSVTDYEPFVHAFSRACSQEGKDLIYFRFARHKELVPADVKLTVYTLHPESGFEIFISELFDIIERHGRGACYVFDSLSELAVDWYSDRMLGNFFRLACPYLYKLDTVAYFALLKNYHSAYATGSIQSTAQVVIGIYRNRDQVYVHPQKVFQRSSPTMYMLHRWQAERFIPVTESAAVTEILARMTQPWIDFTVQRQGFWPRAFLKAQEALEEVYAGRRPANEADEWFKKLLRMVVTRDPRLLELFERFCELPDILAVQKRLIGTGLIGGKSAGMLLARAILIRNDKRWRNVFEEHDSFFIGADVFYTYLVQNDCWWATRKQRDPETLLEGAEEARKKLLSGSIPEDIRQQFAEMLNYFGQSPIIVRSSSLLEDNYGNAFSGKYESVFCANQGSPEDRLENFMAALRTVYASTMSEEALLYRAHRGLLDKDEQMALLVQRVSGAYHGKFFLPQVSGVGYSFNPFVWNSAIDPEEGMLRLVFGLGTRAVNRIDDDYTRIVALGNPRLRPESAPAEASRYTQQKVDILDLEENRHSSRYFHEVAREAPALPLELFASRDQRAERLARERGMGDVFPYVLTFDNLLGKGTFVRDMRTMLKTLQKTYEFPVDVEFTVNFREDRSYRIHLLQCRPFQVKVTDRSVVPPKDISADDLILACDGPIIGSGRACDVDRLIYVVPSVYGALGEHDRYAVARLIGKVTHEHGNNKTIVLLGPGRWGTTMPSLGVPTSFAEINTVSVIGEIAAMHDGLVPEISLGTHFFNDLVEADMLYLAVLPGRTNHRINEGRIKSFPNHLTKLLPEAAQWSNAVWVVDAALNTGDPDVIAININSVGRRALCYCRRRGEERQG